MSSDEPTTEEHLQAIRKCHRNVIDEVFKLRFDMGTDQGEALFVLAQSGKTPRDIMNWKNGPESEVPFQYRKQVQAIRELQEGTVARFLQLPLEATLPELKAYWGIFAEGKLGPRDIEERLKARAKSGAATGKTPLRSAVGQNQAEKSRSTSIRSPGNAHLLRCPYPSCPKHYKLYKTQSGRNRHIATKHPDPRPDPPGEPLPSRDVPVTTLEPSPGRNNIYRGVGRDVAGPNLPNATANPYHNGSRDGVFSGSENRQVDIYSHLPGQTIYHFVGRDMAGQSTLEAAASPYRGASLNGSFQGFAGGEAALQSPMRHEQLNQTSDTNAFFAPDAGNTAQPAGEPMEH